MGLQKRMKENGMEITNDTKLKELIKAYPWLIDEAVKEDERLKVLRTPLGKMMIGKADINEAAKRSGYPAEKIIEKIREAIRKHEREAE